MPFGRPGFDGEFRTKPLQSLGGFNRNGNRDRLSLIQEAASERKRREDMRRHVNFIQKFQNEIRRSLAFKRATNMFRQTFDTNLEALVNTKNCDLIHHLVKQFAFFCDFTKPNVSFDDPDAKRMILFTQFLITNDTLVLSAIQHNNSNILCRSFAKLFVNHVHLLGTIQTYQLERYSPILQTMLNLFETYLDSKNTTVQFTNATWALLVESRYFEMLSIFLKTNPSCMEAVFDGLISKPFFTNYDDSNNRRRRIRAFFAEFWNGFPMDNAKYQILEKICNIIQTGPADLLDASHLLYSVEFNFTTTNDESLGFILSYSAFLKILSQVHKPLNSDEFNIFLMISQQFCILLKQYVQAHEQFKFQIKNEDDCESDDEDHAESSFYGIILCELDKIFKLFGNKPICDGLTMFCNENMSRESMLAICTIGHNIILFSNSALYRNEFLQILTCRRAFLRQIWNFVLTEMATPERTYLSIVTNFTDFSQFQVDWESFLPTIVLFCALFSHTFKTLDDIEFFSEYTNDIAAKTGEETIANKYNAMAFKLQELIKMSSYLKDICISMVEFMFREMTNREVNVTFPMIDEQPKKRDIFLLQSWNLLKRYSFKLLKHIYARNIRRPFCPENHWISSKVSLGNLSPQVLNVSIEFRNQYFSHVFTTNTANIQNLRLPIPIRDIINMTIAQELPMVIPFEARVEIFQSFIGLEKRNYDHENFHPTHTVMIRRSHIYEDSFDKLSKNNISDMKKRVRIQLQSQLGLTESGIDGGGVFREFLSEVLRAAFDPNRAFFKVTSDGLLYPNPNIHVLMENSGAHYYFIGRMLGKAIYENMLIDLPFAPFFLTKLLAKNLYSDVDINHLSSLDPELYQNLISLKKYNKNVADLNLDFTHVTSELGVNIVTDLKPNGANIAVTDSNRIEYIHRMADYKLNKQIRNQCADFKRGFYDVVSFDWIRMFDTNEIQILISGAQVPIDIDDLRKNTVYSCGYSNEHPVIQTFWEAVEEFTDQEKKQLLRFITSCSRPPLLGFKDLYPKMCIQNCGDSNRLPTSSTCMNLLKLPEIRDKQTLKERLLYSINSNSGFELS